MSKTFVCVLLLSSVCFAQALPPGLGQARPAEPAEIPATAPVITLQGLCPNAPAGTQKGSPDCKTVITKAEFEKIINTLNPKLPLQARESVANDYAKMLVLSTEARKRGLEETPRFKELLEFTRMQIAARELVNTAQEESKPTEAEIEKYYKDNPGKYEQISLKRIFIPRNNPNAKPTDPKPTDETLKAEGEKARARLVAGDDPDKVEKDFYEAEGSKMPPPPTTIPNWRRDAVPPSQVALFDLKPGDISPVTVEPAGVYVYKVIDKKMIPIESVRSEIEAQLGAEKLRSTIDSLTSSVKPEFNQAYFGGRSQLPPGIVGPASAPRAENSNPSAPAPSTGTAASTPKK